MFDWRCARVSPSFLGFVKAGGMLMFENSGMCGCIVIWFRFIIFFYFLIWIIGFWIRAVYFPLFEKWLDRRFDHSLDFSVDEQKEDRE